LLDNPLRKRRRRARSVSSRRREVVEVGWDMERLYNQICFFARLEAECDDSDNRERGIIAVEERWNTKLF
jgi:hypothetical protein